MVRRDCFAHIGPDAVVDAWLASLAHRRILVASEYRELGMVGVRQLTVAIRRSAGAPLP